MPSFLNRSLGLPPAIPSGSAVKCFRVDDHHRGLISGDNANRVASSVLRRTLSAAELYPRSGSIKNTVSVEHLHRLSDEDDNGSGAIEDIWSSIEKKTEDLEQRPVAPLRQSSADVWGSILSEKTAENDDVSNAYVHPLVKRTASCLSEKSLEICTESLGSETGADVFSYKNDAVAAEEDQIKVQPEKEVGPTEEVAKPRLYIAAASTKKVSAVANRSSTFPPPLPSLGHRGGGANLQMRSHRENGRLVLEAVSVPSRNCFRAERNGGRLLLTFSGATAAADSDDDDDDEMEENVVGEEVLEDDEAEWEEEDDQEDAEDNEDDDDGEDKEMKEGAAMVMENVLKRRGGATLSYVHYKFLCLTRTNSGPWSHRLNKVVNTLEEDDDDNGVDIQLASSTLAQSLSMGASLNKYVYSWRAKSGLTSAATVEKMKDGEGAGGVVVVEAAVGKGWRGGQQLQGVVDDRYTKLLPFLKGCNKLYQQQQPKRASLLLGDAVRCVEST